MLLTLVPTGLFQERSIPPGTIPAGFAALCREFNIQAPVRRPCSISDQHIRDSHRQDGEWLVFDRRYWPGKSVADHLTFALRHEDIDLLILKQIFDAAPRTEIEQMVRDAPTGIAARRAWCLYEILTGRTLDLEDAPAFRAIDLLDPKRYFTAEPRISKRHRVRNNLLGTRRFCPTIRRTPILTGLVGIDLATKAKDIVGRTSAHFVGRAASFMLLADSQASFRIEGERVPRTRLERWGRAVLQAGKNSLSLDEIIRLQGVLIQDNRFVHAGLRRENVFLGERDLQGEPMPEFIGALPNELENLMAGLLETTERMRDGGIDPVLQAAATAFGFVYVHPLEDGNGRVHRCLIHHVLAERKFTPPGMVFPVSSVMLERIADYRATLQAHSSPLMPFISWRPTVNRNVEVLNDTTDFYRYFDCTAEAEFLYGCVARAVEQDLPREIDYLQRHDLAVLRVMNAVEMPNRLAQDLIAYIRQNNGNLSKRRRAGEFQKLGDEEVAQIEAIVREAFSDFVR